MALIRILSTFFLIAAGSAVCVAQTLQMDPTLLSPGGAPPPAAAQPASFKNEELEQLAAPIALYPDALVAQILMASTYPLEVVEAARWSKANPQVKDKALEDAMQQ